MAVTLNTVLEVVCEMSSSTTSNEVSGLARQLLEISAKRRCSILFHLLISDDSLCFLPLMVSRFPGTRGRVGPSRRFGGEAPSGLQAASAPQGQEVVAVVVNLPFTQAKKVVDAINR